MTTPPTGAGLTDSANHWSRVLGVSLRPWSGDSPLTLLLRGAVQVALSCFFLWLAFRLMTDDSLRAYTAETSSIRMFGVLIAVAAIAIALIGVARICVGLLDSLSTRQVSGTVVSVRDRQTLDFLPHSLLQLVYHRNPHKIETRRRRTELVLDTPTGTRQWTVRKRHLASGLRPGATVQLTVTPLAGHVSNITAVPRS